MQPSSTAPASVSSPQPIAVVAPVSAAVSGSPSSSGWVSGRAAAAPTSAAQAAHGWKVATHRLSTDNLTPAKTSRQRGSGFAMARSRGGSFVDAKAKRNTSSGSPSSSSMSSPKGHGADDEEDDLEEEESDGRPDDEDFDDTSEAKREEENVTDDEDPNLMKVSNSFSSLCVVSRPVPCCRRSRTVT